MSRNRTFLISIIALILTVPWWFFEYSSTILGLPDWAFYTVFMALIYSVVITYILGKYWKTKD
ncbi:MAG: hypothetical protein U9N31_05730 [Candidatus Marinimicrobia bacterium]|nr:hypothetical protein [Candidatus Neomarinimicrobiota bacterium]